MSVTHNWSTKTLDEMAEHVAYEMTMLARTTENIVSGRFPPTHPDPTIGTVGNALLESSLVHLRSLDDFLGLTNPNQDDDVLAVHYLPDWSPKRFLTDDERAYINKRMAHITTLRKSGPAPWQLRRCHEGFDECVLFLRELEAKAPFRAMAFRRWFDWTDYQTLAERSGGT